MGNENRKQYKDIIDIDGKFQLDCTLYYDDANWELNYYFEPAKKDVVITGTIDNGKLSMVSDSSGYAAPLLPAMQGMYDRAVGL